MPNIFLLLACVIFSINATTTQLESLQLFKDFMVKYGKTYSTQDERERRFHTFLANLKLAYQRNELEGENIHGISKFMDLTPIEFKNYLGFFPKPSSEESPVVTSDFQTSGRQMCSNSTNCDYSELGAVSPVKDQGQCGSCWAFSATQAVETAWYLNGNTLPILAPQELVDCDKVDGGCNGGDTPTAYEFIISEGGMESEVEYPYTAKDGKCSFSSSKVVASISNYSWAIPPCSGLKNQKCNNQDEASLWNFVQHQGPVSICVDAEPWQTYTGGIFSGSNCQHSYYSLDHCVHLTGFGVDNGQKYWLVKNSWGTDWGEEGYIRLAYGQNVCGVADEVTIAIV